MPTSAKKGISAKSFGGLSKKRMTSKASTNFGKRLVLRPGDTVPVQFLQGPDDMREFDIHSFQEDGKWVYVPCLGDNCPLCEDEDSKKSKVTYRFVACVYNLKEKKVQLLEGPKDLASRIFYRYERAPGKFLKRTFEITKFNTQPVTYDVSIAEEPLVKTTNLEVEDLQKYIDEEARRYYGDEAPIGKSSLEATDDEADDVEDDDVTEDVDADELREELEDLTEAQLKARAKKNGAKLAEYKGLDLDELIDFVIEQEAPSDEDEESEDDEDDDDEDLEDEDLDEEDDEEDEDEDEEDDDEDEEDDDDEPPFETKKSSPRKAPARKAAAKKAAATARKAPARKASRR